MLNKKSGSTLWVVALCFAFCIDAKAQFNERPDLAGSGSPAVDASGRSVKNMRVRAVHSTDANELGSSAYFIRRDPFLAYQLGRNLNFREFRDRDGIFDATVSGLAGPMPDGTTAKITANNQTSCSGCHNLPQGTPGGGVTFHKDSGKGRNSPHYFGAGVMEQLAIQIRHDMLDAVDTNSDGWIDAVEANATLDVSVETTPGGAMISMGNPTLDANGKPQLNNIFRVWYVDANGEVVDGATSVDGVNTFGYNFDMIVWGWGQGEGRNALNPTNRAFLIDPYKAHGGLESYDPTTSDDADNNGVSAPSLSGAIQFPATHLFPDPGLNVDPLGFSTDDPDGDGHLTEISEGDLDLAEFFMLNAPRPAFNGRRFEWDRGMDLMDSMGCTECHISEWQIDTDRRYFDLDVAYNNQTERLEGELNIMFHQDGDDLVPDGLTTQIVGLFTDFRHHDMGETFAEKDFSGTINRKWRTPPLWGVGSGFPWGHDGQSLTLEDAILRHGGEGQVAADIFANASSKEKRQLVLFLNQLQLFDIETLPADIDGVGGISDNFFVAGKDTGPERFNAEWLFIIPVEIQGPFINVDGEVIRSDAAMNVADAYGENLPFRVDTDEDGWPDVWDNAPNTTGYKDGVN